MTTKIVGTLGLLLAGLQLSQAQTADYFVAQGRGFLANSNVVAAHNSFSNAVSVAPTHQTANAFYAATRLLSWPYSLPASNFLNRLGFPVAGRDPFNWTSYPPVDTNGTPAIPPGLNAAEGSAFIRTNLLPLLLGAQENLSRITQAGFELTLTPEETRTVEVTLDFGDIQFARAALYAAEYCCYTIYSLNANVLLKDIEQMHKEGRLTMERVLQAYPDLLTFATTNDIVLTL